MSSDYVSYRTLDDVKLMNCAACQRPITSHAEQERIIECMHPATAKRILAKFPLWAGRHLDRPYCVECMRELREQSETR